MLTPECPPFGATVRLQVRASVLSGAGLLMETRGQVVRVEPMAPTLEVAGFAASTRSLKLRDCKTGVTNLDREYRAGRAMTAKSGTGDSEKPN